MPGHAAARAEGSQKHWSESVKPFARSDVRRSLWQIANTLIPYITLWVLMYYSLRVSYWLTLLLAVPAAGFMVRLFIQFHDAGHGSFFPSRQANDLWGIITGVLTFTPYYHWRHNHAVHHASAGNLDRRGVGDVVTYTVDEWLGMPPLQRFGYRLYRHPVVLLGLGSLYTFVIGNRFSLKEISERSRNSIVTTNFFIFLMVLTLSLVMGLGNFLLIMLPIAWLGGMAGVWMFYVQHQFEDVYWERQENWDYLTAALDGSSYYKLPKLLQWFSGNIGLHHVHHLNPRIPNYNLQPCVDSEPMFQIEPITLLSSLNCLRFRLYDEASRRLVGFRDAIARNHALA